MNEETARVILAGADVSQGHGPVTMSGPRESESGAADWLIGGPESLSGELLNESAEEVNEASAVLCESARAALVKHAARSESARADTRRSELLCRRASPESHEDAAD
jgi:hypothetical protein